MSDMRNIALIVVYFGNLPSSFPAWLISCSYNQQIDWLVFTDSKIDQFELPPNVVVRHITLQRFCEAVSEELGFTVRFRQAYKTIDFKPLYWILLKGERKRYDFWGYCDLDMIFGDLRAHVSAPLLDSYDKIFSCGHLTLYRNCEHANQMYRNAPPSLNWRNILSSEKAFGFDEHCGVNAIWQFNNGRVFQDESMIADIDPHLAGFELQQWKLNKKRQVFFFDSGKLLQGFFAGNEWVTREYMYIHFQKRSLPFPCFAHPVKSFYITPRGFIQREPGIVPSMQSVQTLSSVPENATNKFAEFNYRIRKLVRSAKRHVTSTSAKNK